VIDRSSPVPLYFQLATLIEQGIASGQWEPGARLPSEPELCEQFGLSRATVRQAFGRLEHRGLIGRLRGQGTFVQEGEPGLWLLQSSEGSFQEEVDRMGRTVRSKVLRAERGRLPEWACRALELEPAADGATLERLRFVDGDVALYAVNHLPLHIADAALAIDNPNESLYRRLRERAGAVPHGGRRILEAIAADSGVAELLDVRPGDPLILIESVTWDADMRPFDCYRAWLRTDRTKIDIQAHDPGAAASQPLPTHDRERA